MALFFFEYQMISRESLLEAMTEYFEGKSIFLVDLKVVPGNKITVYVDGDAGASVSDCQELHRFLESSFDREQEDYDLTVSTPGIDQPLKVRRQYVRNIGRNVKVVRTDGAAFSGKLIKADSDTFMLITRSKEAVEGRKNKIWVEREVEFSYPDAAQTIVEISFK